MKSIIVIILAAVNVLSSIFSSVADRLFFPELPQSESVNFAQQLGSGWNLGNTLDACKKGSPDKAGLETQTMWGNPETTREMIAYIAASGFKTVRIPITWAQHLGDAPDYTIDKAWLDRVNEIVDYVLDCGMYAIINVHHDDAFWLVTDYENEEKATEILVKIWAQLSERFADYDERLIFETMNEPRVFEGEDEWNGNSERREVVNRLNAAALKTIRSSGGNNAKRFVMIPTYAASVGADNMAALQLPQDSRVMVSLHFYYNASHDAAFADCENALSIKEKREIYHTFETVYNMFISKGYGVVIGEFGWTDRSHTENLSSKAEFYVQTARKFGISCIVWDDGGNFGLFDRTNIKWEYGDYAAAVL